MIIVLQFVLAVVIVLVIVLVIIIIIDWTLLIFFRKSASFIASGTVIPGKR
jgi:hypothetical protein